MNRKEAFAEAVAGQQVRAVDMAPGTYVDYQFNGWRINFPSGSSSGYTPREHDEAVEWELYKAPKQQGWASYPEPKPTNSQRLGRGMRAVPSDLPINDIGWTLDRARMVAEEAKAIPVRQGWPMFNKEPG